MSSCFTSCSKEQLWSELLPVVHITSCAYFTWFYATLVQKVMQLAQKSMDWGMLISLHLQNKTAQGQRFKKGAAFVFCPPLSRSLRCLISSVPCNLNISMHRLTNLAQGCQTQSLQQPTRDTNQNGKVNTSVIKHLQTIYPKQTTNVSRLAFTRKLK